MNSVLSWVRNSERTNSELNELIKISRPGTNSQGFSAEGESLQNKELDCERVEPPTWNTPPGMRVE